MELGWRFDGLLGLHMSIATKYRAMPTRSSGLLRAGKVQCKISVALRDLCTFKGLYEYFARVHDFT